MAEEALAVCGKTAGRPAALNPGDRFACASAKAGGPPPLRKGEDFARTELA